MSKSRRNRMAGNHPSYDKLGMSDKAISRKKAYDKKYHSTEERKKYRAELNRENKKRGTYGNGDGKDMSHKADGSMVSEVKSRNRARNGSNGKSRLK